jgi:hypothetical protein
LPLSPLHFSAIAPLHFKRPEIFDVTALLCSSTFVDLELLFFFLSGRPTYHGFWHSYLFVFTIYPVVLGVVIYLMERKFERIILGIYGFFRFYPTNTRYPFKTIYSSCLVGGISHIFFDMWTHENSSYVLFPLRISSGNPFWIGDWDIIIHILVILLSLYTVFLWIKQIYSK